MAPPSEAALLPKKLQLVMIPVEVPLKTAPPFVVTELLPKYVLVTLPVVSYIRVSH